MEDERRHLSFKNHEIILYGLLPMKYEYVREFSLYKI